MAQGKSESEVLLLREEALRKLEEFYADSKLPLSNPYLCFRAKENGVSVSAYLPKDGVSKVLFQGEGAKNEAKIWEGYAEEPVLFESKGNRPPKKASTSYPSNFPQIGSDEVGTGDFFGPMIVCASFVEEKDLSLLKELGVTDSKAMEDDHILEIGPRLIHAFDYSCLTLPPEKLNLLIAEGENMNSLKAKLHNQALSNLKKKHPTASLYQDQFAPEHLYYSYLKDVKEVQRGITFATKGEAKWPSVALASVIARYAFLRKMEEMGKPYNVSFPFGAGEEVDRFAKQFKKKFGMGEFPKLAKANFKNYERVLLS